MVLRTTLQSSQLPGHPANLQLCLNDDVIFCLGTDRDYAQVLNSAGLDADEGLAGVIVGLVPRYDASIPPNSVLFSNTTDDGDLVFFTAVDGNSNESYRIDGSSQQMELRVDLVMRDGHLFLIGDALPVTTSVVPAFQELGTAEIDATGVIGRWSADALAPSFQFLKSRNAAIHSHTIVQDNDVVGRAVFIPDDGSVGDFDTEAAIFQAEVDDGSPAEGDVGMAFVWQQMPGGGGAIAETMRLSAAGELVPPSDNSGNVGTASLRWTLIRGVTITSGDYRFENDWYFTEAERVGRGEGIALVRPDGTVVNVWQ